MAINARVATHTDHKFCTTRLRVSFSVSGQYFLKSNSRLRPSFWFLVGKSLPQFIKYADATCHTKPAAAEKKNGRKKKINKNTKLKSYQLTGVHLCAVEFPVKSYSRNKSMPLSNSPHNVFIFSSITVLGFKQRPEMISVKKMAAVYRRHSKSF